MLPHRRGRRVPPDGDRVEPHHFLRVDTHPEVYEPAEDSWLLARAALRALDGLPRPARAVDVGTGAGVTAIALAEAGARVVAVDLNPHAVRLARANARAARLPLDVVRGDLLAPLCPNGRFDLVTFNPPYLPSEDHERVEGWLDHAFHGGDAGVEVPIRFLRQLPGRLRPDGVALVVLSSRGDVDLVLREAEALGFQWDVVAEDRFFFERLTVHRFRRA